MYINIISGFQCINTLHGTVSTQQVSRMCLRFSSTHLPSYNRHVATQGKYNYTLSCVFTVKKTYLASSLLTKVLVIKLMIEKLGQMYISYSPSDVLLLNSIKYKIKKEREREINAPRIMSSHNLAKSFLMTLMHPE